MPPPGNVRLRTSARAMPKAIKAGVARAVKSTVLPNARQNSGSLRMRW